jgi:hypothetical protein
MEHDQRMLELAAMADQVKADAKNRQRKLKARDRAVKKKYGTTSVLSAVATDATRLARLHSARRVAEEWNNEVEIRYVCICPRRSCKAHEVETS